MWLWAALVAFGTVLASLYSGDWVLLTISGMTAVTVLLTFALPVMHKPRLPGMEEG